MKHILVLDDISERGLALLEEAEGISYEIRTGLKGDDLRDALLNADGAVCRSGVKITAESLEGNTRLAAIVRAGVGTDNIDRDASTRQGIIVMNTPAGNTVSTAEHTMALLLALSRNIPQAHESLVAGKWDRKKLTGNQVAGKTLGVVGLGRIGRSVAERAMAFEMNVIALDPYFSNEQAEKLGVKKVDQLNELLPQVDYLTVHTPKTKETDRLIGADEIAMLPKGAKLINCARGGIYEEQALVDGLKSGHLGGVALDVYENEPCTDSPLFSMPGTVCTPHLGASTEEAQMQVAVEAVELLLDYLQTGNVKHSVNAIAVAPKELEKLGGFINVAFRLGSLLAQWIGGAIEECKIEVKGALATEDTRILQTAVCAGMIQHVVDEDVNIVNAHMLCLDRGIKVQVSSNQESRAFRSIIRVALSGNGMEHTAAGTLFGSDMPRLVGMDKFRLESFLDGDMLVFFHEDLPGVIGHVGNLMGDSSVNIAQMSVGRSKDWDGGRAIGVMNLDAPVDPDIGKKVAAMDVVKEVKLIHLPPADWLPSWLSSVKSPETD